MYIHDVTHLLKLLTLLTLVTLLTLLIINPLNLQHTHTHTYTHTHTHTHTHQYQSWRQPDLPSEESDAIAYVLHMAVVAVVQHLIKAIHSLYGSSRNHHCLSKKKNENGVWFLNIEMGGGEGRGWNSPARPRTSVV